MSVKLLYVLVSQSSDYYAEQAILSMLSAKYRMPEITISLLMDQSTKSNLEGFRKKVLELSDEQIVVPTEDSSPLIQSRILKTKMRSLIVGDFLYVDVDSVWAGTIDESDFACDVMGVLDANCEMQFHKHRDYIKNQFLQLDYAPIFENHVNGGVLYMKDSAEASAFCNDWNLFWKNSCQKGICFDQPALHQTIDLHKKCFGILDGSYNAQIAVNLNFFAKAKIVHYHPYGQFTDTIKFPYWMQQKQFWDKVKRNEDEAALMWAVQHPQECFDSFFQYKTDKEIIAEQKKIYGLMMTILTSSKFSAKLLTAVGEFIAKVVGKFY